MNSTFLQSQARALARLATTHDAMSHDQGACVRNLYRRVYARDPSADETEFALAYVNGAIGDDPADDVESTWHYGYGSLDPVGKRVREFHPFPKFVKDRWGGAKLPDPHLGWVHLTATGGHPGSDAKHCAIRRWVSPLAADIESTAHSAIPPKKGMESAARSSPAVRAASRHGPSRTAAARHRSRRCTSSRAKKSTSSWTACRTKTMTVLRGLLSSGRSSSPVRLRA